MTDRIDRKLGNVVLATFQYRHEAEFAAGFLDEAEIPYRLQIDDPSMGLTVSAPATLWVREMDLEAAREVLDLQASADLLPSAEPIRRAGTAKGRIIGRPSSPGSRVGPRPATHPGGALSAVERGVALTLFGAGAGAAWLLFQGPGGAFWASVVAIFVAPLGLAAALGRTLPPVRDLLRAISGTAP